MCLMESIGSLPNFQGLSNSGPISSLQHRTEDLFPFLLWVGGQTQSFPLSFILSHLTPRASGLCSCQSLNPTDVGRGRKERKEGGFDGDDDQEVTGINGDRHERTCVRTVAKLSIKIMPGSIEKKLTRPQLYVHNMFAVGI